MATNQSTRTFEDKPATRERTPLMLGLCGPSSSGKTFSALRIAAGIQRVSGGETYVIDTEARRALHYADRFKFRHVPFGAPFSPLDYLSAIEHCVRKGAKQIVVDSMSHEHEGPGGLLEMHAAETERLAKAWRCSEDKAKMSAWQKPKADRRRLINSMLQMECNFILCFRSKPKMKVVRGKDPEQLGYMPIAGDDFVYEMVMKFLLMPGSNGFPTLSSDFEGETAMIKIPAQFRQMFDPQQPKQLSEDIGQAMAVWAAGDAAPPVVTADELKRGLAACSDPATLRTLTESSRVSWSKLGKDDRVSVTRAIEAAKARVEENEQRRTRESERPPAPGQEVDPETGEVRDEMDPPPPSDREPGEDG